VAGEEEDKKGDAEGYVDEAALEVDKSWSIGCVDGCCLKPGVGEVRRKKDKRGRRWSTLNLSGAFAEGVKVHNMFGALQGDESEGQGGEEELKETPPGLDSDSGSEIGVGELVDSDSDDSEVEMREWKIKLRSEKEKGVWKKIVNKKETKEAEVNMEKKVVKSSVGEARRGMETEIGDEEEIFIGDMTAENKKKMKIKFQVADVKKPLMAVKRIVQNGNRVVFAESGSYIINDQTGDKLKLRENGRGSLLTRLPWR
jgi:hypothetical protein